MLYVAHLYALLDQHISKHLHERTDHCSLPFLTSQLSSRMYFSLFRMRSAFTLLERLWWTGVLVDEVLNLLRLWPKPDTNPAANKSKHLHCTSLQITASHRSNDRQILDFDGLKLGLVCHSLFLFSFSDLPDWCFDPQNLVLVQSHDHPTAKSYLQACCMIM